MKKLKKYVEIEIAHKEITKSASTREEVTL